MAASLPRGFIAALLLGTAGSVSGQEVALNLLNACDDIARVFQKIRSSTDSCERATGLIEKTILHSLTFSDVNACFAINPPLLSLNGFRCFSVSMTGHRSLTCYRPTSLDSVADFKAGFSDRFASKVDGYLRQARNCRGSNGDASRVIETTFPPSLMAVAAHEFGFIVQYGATKPGTALVSHGFARTSPATSTAGPEAVEYFSVADGMKSPLPQRTRHGNWRLRVDNSTSVYQKYFQKFAGSGTRIHVAIVDIDLQRAPLAPQLSKSAISSDILSEMLALSLEDEGFEEFSDEQIQDEIGYSRKELQENLVNHLAFGAPKKLMPSPPNFRLLMKATGAKCTQSNKGAFGAYLYSFAGDEGVQVDFGSVSVIVLGFGSCASKIFAGRDYVDNLVEEAKHALLEELRKH